MLISVTTHGPTVQTPPLWTISLTVVLVGPASIILSRLIEEILDAEDAESNLRCGSTDVLITLIIPAGFSLQSYFGMQKSSTMDSSNTAGSFKVDDPASFVPPKIEITGIEAKQAPPPRPHKLKPRDMNVLTPSGFWWLSRSLPLSHILFFSPLPGLLIYCSAFLSPPSSLF